MSASSPSVARNLVVWITTQSAASPTARAGTPLHFVFAQRSLRVSYNRGLNPPLYEWAEPRLDELPDFVATAADEQQFEGFRVPSYGSVTLRNTDGGLDLWDTYHWRGSTVRVYDLAADADEVSLDGLTPTIEGTADLPAVSRRLVELPMRDRRFGFVADLLLSVPYRGHQFMPRFNGSSMYGSTGATTITPTSALTWEAWVSVHTAPSGTCGILVHSSAFAAGTTDVSVEMTTTRTIRAVCYNSGGGTVATSYVAAPGRLGDPFHLAVTVAMSGSTMTVNLFFDGAVVATSSATVTRTLAALPLYLAAAPGPFGYAPVSLSDLRFWNVARETTDIQAAMRSRLKGDETGLVGLWRLDDGAGATCVSALTGGASIALTGTPLWISAAEGSPDLAGQLQRRALGLVENIPCQVVDSFNLIYRIARGPLGDLGSSQAFRDKGSPYAEDTAGDYDSLDGFVQATVATGKYVTCLRHGLVKLGTAPQGELTADVLGEQFDATVYAPRYSVRLNGSSQYASATLGSWSAGSWSAGAWVCLRATPGVGARIFHNDAAGPAATRILRFPTAPGTSPVAICRNDAGTAFIAQDTTKLLTLNRWHHVMASFDLAAQVLRLYVDGILAASTATSGAFTTAPSTSVYWGASATPGNYLQADLARMFVANGVALTPAEATLFQNPFAYYSGHLWVGSEGSGTSVSDHGAIGTALTLTGSPAWAPGPSPDFAAPWLERFVPLATYGAADFVVTIPNDRQSFLDLPPYRIGFVTSEPADSVATLLGAVLASVGAALPSPETAIRFARPGYAWSPGQAKEVTETGATEVNRWEVQEFTPQQALEAVHTVALSYRPVWFTQAADGLFSTVTPENRDLWGSERRVHEEPDGRLLGILGQAVPKHEVETLLVEHADAITEARRRLLLYGRIRRYTTVVLDGVRPAPGDAIDLSDYSTRFGLDTEPLLRVVSVMTRLRSARSTCTVFRA